MLQDKKFWAILDHQLFMQFNIYIYYAWMYECMYALHEQVVSYESISFKFTK